MIEVDYYWRNGFCQTRLMRVSASGNAEELVRLLYVSEPARVADSCAAAAGVALAREEREYQDDDKVQ